MWMVFFCNCFINFIINRNFPLDVFCPVCVFCPYAYGMPVRVWDDKLTEALSCYTRLNLSTNSFVALLNCSIFIVVPYVDTIALVVTQKPSIIVPSTYGIKDLEKDKVCKTYTKYWANLKKNELTSINFIVMVIERNM